MDNELCSREEKYTMRKTMLIVMAASIAGIITISSQPNQLNLTLDSAKDTTLQSSAAVVEEKSAIERLYEEIELDGKLNFEAFDLAMKGFDKLDFKNKSIISIIDFSLPSTAKRMYVIDLAKKKLLYHSIVSHGRNTGENYAVNFSNRHGSFQSSLGFYRTENTYMGSNGYSLVINGLEKGINDQAKARAVVIHGADYCSEQIIKSTGRLGRSYGCPALPRELNRPIVNTIKDGTMLFIYANSPQYFAKSTVVKKHDQGMLAQKEESTQGQISLN